LISSLFYCSNSLFAQENSTENISIQEKLENIAEDLENENLDYEDLLAPLAYFKDHPVNLNNTKPEELQELNILNDLQVSSLLLHIQKNGDLISLLELQSIDGFDLETIRKILPYVTVVDHLNSPGMDFREILRNGRFEFLTRYQKVLEKEKGYLPISRNELDKSPNSRYLGGPEKFYTHYRFSYGTDLSAGLTAEKDPGEEFFKGTQKNGFDFYSAHFYIQPNRFVKAIAIGDYQLSFGQGLTTWSGLAFGKSAEVINIKKHGRGISPYRSVDENLFMRGAAGTLSYKNFELTSFVSRKKIDANISRTDTISNELLAVSSLQETGYHTTPSEIADRHVLGELIYGGNLSFKKRRFQAGLTAIETRFDIPVEKDYGLYNRFEFSGKNLGNVGIDYNYIYRNVNLFSEAAMSSNGGYAYLNGLILSLDPCVSMSFLQRDYSRNYQSLHSNAFSESTKPANEKGIYMGLSIRPFSTITISAYYDQFQFPWLKYQVNQPSRGSDYLSQLNYTPSKKLDIYFRIRKRNKFKNTGADESIDFIVPVEQLNYRFNISYSVSPSLKIRSRIENIVYDDSDKKKEKGYFLSQDILYKPISKRYSISLRYALFQTDSYNSRLYSYESDLSGSFSIPAFYNKGSRFYIMFDYNITRNITAWLRYSQTLYDQQKVISEGSLSEIDGNKKSEIKAQVRIRF
jgi:hypothetical protein